MDFGAQDDARPGPQSPRRAAQGSQAHRSLREAEQGQLTVVRAERVSKSSPHTEPVPHRRLVLISTKPLIHPRLKAPQYPYTQASTTKTKFVQHEGYVFLYFAREGASQPDGAVDMRLVELVQPSAIADAPSGAVDIMVRDKKRQGGARIEPSPRTD